MPYIQKDKSGYMKSMVIRRSYTTGEVQVSFLLMKKFEGIAKFTEALVAQCPEIVVYLHSIQINIKNKYSLQGDYENLFGKATY